MLSETIEYAHVLSLCSLAMTTFDAHIDMPWTSGCVGALRLGARYGVSTRCLGVDALGELPEDQDRRPDPRLDDG